MLHPRQPRRKILIRRRQRLIRRDQFRDPPRLRPDEHDQLIAGQLLQVRHLKIKADPTPPTTTDTPPDHQDSQRPTVTQPYTSPKTATLRRPGECLPAAVTHRRTATPPTKRERSDIPAQAKAPRRNATPSPKSR